MRLYIKGDYTKEIPFDYLELAKKMWFENYQGEGIPLSYSGFLQIRDRNDIAIHLKLDKQDYDERWFHVPIQEGLKYRFYSQIDEYLNLDYEDAYVTDFRKMETVYVWLLPILNCSLLIKERSISWLLRLPQYLMDKSVKMI